jgi:hypothetical protein
LTSPADAFRADVARIALTAAYPFGFVLGGGLALIEHGVLTRPTEDVDLFAAGEGSVLAATNAVRAVLEGAGYRVTVIDHDSDLDDLIAGMRYHLSELEVHDEAGADPLRVSLGFLDRTHPPVILGIGPVMALDDLITWKVAALVSRAEVRDFVDVAVFLADHSAGELLAAARRVDPAMEPGDVAAAGRRLDVTPDRAFLPYGLGPEQVALVRDRFVTWPR